MRNSAPAQPPKLAKPLPPRTALKTGLTGRTVLLPTEDAALYEAHVAGFRDRHQPEGEAELNLVQSLAVVG